MFSAYFTTYFTTLPYSLFFWLYPTWPWYVTFDLLDIRKCPCCKQVLWSKFELGKRNFVCFQPTLQLDFRWPLTLTYEPWALVFMLHVWFKFLWNCHLYEQEIGICWWFPLNLHLDLKWPLTFDLFDTEVPMLHVWSKFCYYQGLYDSYLHFLYCLQLVKMFCLLSTSNCTWMTMSTFS